MIKRFKKILASFILIVIIGIFSCGVVKENPPDTFGQDTLQKAHRIIYVSPAGNNYGSGSPSSPLNRIQQAISMASSGDAIKVLPGKYNENIELKTGVNLIGSGIDVTIIIAQEGNIITAKGVDNVIVEGFTLDGEDVCGNGVYLEQCNRSKDGLILRNNRVMNINGNGIQTTYSAGIIENNVIMSVTNSGIDIGYGGVNGPVSFPLYPYVNNNFISRAMTGILMGGHTRCRIQGNTINNVTESGIVCSHGCLALVENNTVKGVGRIGIQCYYARPILRMNLVENCGYSGVGCSASGDSKLRGNIIRNGQQYGIYIDETSFPDLGRADDKGNNEVYENADFDVYSLAQRQITAVGNWWGISPPRPEQFYGDVYYGEALEYPVGK